MSNIHALSLHPSCMHSPAENLGVTLKPNPAFIPKVADVCLLVGLAAFQPPLHSTAEERRVHMLCPFHTLHVYVERTRAFREADQLFVSWMKPHRAMTKQKLSHWTVDAITLAYS